MDQSNFETEYVHRFYSKKAMPFSDSRVKPWPFTIAFMKKYATPSSLVLDSGCGNGRQFISANTVGIDFSENLLREAAAKQNLGRVRANVLAEPFRDDVFDTVLSIAVVHHLSTHERRVQCLTELRRVLKPGGNGLVYAWHTAAAAKKKFHHIKDTEYFVSWKGETDAMRYYFLFTEEMLRSLCEEAGFVIVESGVEQESVYTVVTKV